MAVKKSRRQAVKGLPKLPATWGKLTPGMNPRVSIVIGKFELVRGPSGALMLNRVNDGEGMGVNEARLEKCLAAFYRREF